MKDISLKNEYFLIKKNQNSNNIINENLNDNKINLFFYKYLIKGALFSNYKIHYGKFKISEDSNFVNIINIIISPSEYYEKITIVEGWTKKDLIKQLSNYFNHDESIEEIEYNEIIANTYYLSNLSFKEFKKKLKVNFNNLKHKYSNNKLLEDLSFNDILIIGSLLEKEGIDYMDRKNIYSVIRNRLERKMKLQIDATVIYAITQGKTRLKRKLNYQDLTIKNDYNTYHIYGLPPKPISYVGLKTIELIFEDYKTNYLFYFYDSYEKKHVFSKNYKEHLRKLNEYRSK